MTMDQEHLEKLLPEAREALESTDAERINFIKQDKFVTYTRAGQILDKLEELLTEPKRTRMPCLLIVGESNNGKTSLVEKFSKAHLPTDGINQAAVPVLLVGAPSKPKIDMLYDEILGKLLLPFKKSDSESKKIFDITYHFTNLDVKVLIVDEIHNILSGSFAKRREFMNGLKNLNNGLRIPIVLVGTKDALNATTTDMQISSRFPPMLLPLWKLDEDIVALLDALEATLPLKLPSGLAKISEIARKILSLGEGILGDIVSVIRESAILAIKNGTEKITMEEIKKCGVIKPSERRGLTLVEV